MTDERCRPHDLLPGQCECTTRSHEPDYALNRAMVLRDHEGPDEPPQVTATIVGVPTTDTLTRRLGHQIPTIGYGHWDVLVDRRAVIAHDRAREAAKAKRERAMLVAALTAPRAHALAATITIR
jgi:hypothetical protein